MVDNNSTSTSRSTIAEFEVKSSDKVYKSVPTVAESIYVSNGAQLRLDRPSAATYDSVVVPLLGVSNSSEVNFNMVGTNEFTIEYMYTFEIDRTSSVDLQAISTHSIIRRKAPLRTSNF